MEVVLSASRIGDNDGSPFQNEDVREWSHVDRLTGMLERARIETGRWQARTNQSAHSYGKVIDSRERNSADGSVVQKARRQVEVFQSQGVGGRSFQIVRASQWSSSRVTDSTGPLSVPPGEVHQKTDFSESPNGKSDLWRLNGDDSNLSKLSQVSWLCRRLHNDTVKDRASSVTRQNPSPSSIRRSKKFDTKELRRSPNLLSHKKSTSNEDVTNVPEITNSEPLSSFTRGCQSRRSLQVQNSLSTSPPKPTDQTSRRQNSLEDIRRTESSKTTQNSTSSTREIYSKVEQGRKQSLARSEVRDSFRESNEGLKKNPSKLKSYVLGMENQSSLSGNYSSPSSNSGRLPVLTFRGPSECRDHEMKKDEYDYPKSISVATTLPKTIQLVPTSKANTTVVHLTHDTSVHAEIPCLRQNSIPLQSTIKMIPYNPPDSTDFSKNVPRSENPVEKNLSPDRGSSTTETSTAFPGKPAKKVGFCKTEVHFAADSGKVNIVETDGKPPPSNRFRRKRRNTLVNGNVNGNVNKNLPLIHFGDTSYEKYIFGGTGNPQGEKVPLEEAGLGARNLDREVRKKIDDGVGRGVNLKSILEPGFKDDKNFEYGSLKSCFTGDEKTVVQKHRGHTTTVNLGASVLPRLEEEETNSKAEKVPERIQSPDLPRKLRPGSGTVLEDILDPREESKVITSDTENNQVLVKMVTIHKPVIARVENDHSPKMEKRTSESLSSNFAKREGRSRSGSRSRSRSSSCSKDRSGALPAGAEDPYHETKEPCDKGGSMGRQGETGRNEEEPLYANIFEMSGRATPIYENCQIPGNDTEVEEKPTSRNLVEVSLETLKRDTEEALEAISDLSEASSSGSKSRKNSEKPKIGRKKLDVISETNTQALRNEEKNSKPKVKVVKARSKNLGTVSSTSSVESLSRAQEQKTHARISRNPDSKTSSVNSSPRFNRLGENCNVCGSCRVNGRAERGSRGSLDKDPSKTRAKINGSNRQVSTVNGDGAEKQAPSGSIKSKKPIEIVYETAVFNMKNEKLSKPTKAKESKSPRYINDLICGSRNKSSTDRKRVKAVAAAPHAGGKGATQPSRHWK
ncbi:uncharacterized protein LOC105695521 isoform X3 [Orussus abietinus]|uniref:uncharacterized protein LOC105695521 isoform X3 n=1 Tax=Orussus abietinus TaxID=222816 RepID=UPI00062636F6|nr:uncharacterized protein LOC105695521 isoform X3 [Orussus abietinus]